MTYSNHKLIQKHLRKWIDLEDWEAPFAATLTLKQRLNVHDGADSRSVALTRNDASQNLRHFLNVLNRRVFKSSAQRHGLKVPVFPVLEGGNDTRLHYHLLIGCPRPELIDAYPALLIRTWHMTQWGYNECEIKPADSGWITYMTKLRDKPDFASSIDWQNFHTP